MHEAEAGLRHRLQRALRQIEGQHRHLRPIYAELEIALESGGPRDAREWLDRYREALDAHFRLEEEVLFPALQGLRPDAADPLAALCLEHGDFLAQLDDLANSLETAYGHPSAARVATLGGALAQHERVEERLVAGLLGMQKAD